MLVTIKTTTPEASERLLKALVGILNPTELVAFQEKIKKEVARVEKQLAKRKKK